MRLKILDKIQDHTHCRKINASINAKTWFQSDGESKFEEKIIVSYRTVALEENFKHRKEKTS